MTYKFTSGPWEYSDGSIWAKSPFGARVRLVDIRKHAAMNGIDGDANAHLIAEAPELLKRLVAANEYLERIADRDDLDDEGLAIVLESRAVINKATGN